MKNLFKSIGVATTLATAVSACDRQDTSLKKEGLDLRTPVVTQNFSHDINLILNYCQFAYDHPVCQDIDVEGKNHKIEYLKSSEFVQSASAHHQECKEYYAHNTKQNPEESCAYLVDDIVDQAEQHAPYAEVVEANAVWEYIQSELDKNNPEMQKLLKESQKLQKE